MSNWSSWYSFTEANVKGYAPDRKGVYALGDGKEIVYYGMSERSIRTRLLSHLNGTEAPATQNAQTFSFKESDNPVADEQAALNAHKRENGGRLPRYNSVG